MHSQQLLFHDSKESHLSWQEMILSSSVISCRQIYFSVADQGERFGNSSDELLDTINKMSILYWFVVVSIFVYDIARPRYHLNKMFNIQGKMCHVLQKNKIMDNYEHTLFLSFLTVFYCLRFLCSSVVQAAERHLWWSRGFSADPRLESNICLGWLQLSSTRTDG